MLPASVTWPLKGQALASLHLPEGHLSGCHHYWLELCIDPPRSPRMVPVASGSLPRPHAGFPACVKPTSRDRVAHFRAPPGGDFHPFICGRVPLVSVPLHILRRPVSASPNLVFRGDWVEGSISAASARCNRTSPITGIRLQRMLGQDGRSWPDRIGGPVVP